MYHSTYNFFREFLKKGLVVKKNTFFQCPRICISILFLNLCYETYFFSWIICRYIGSPYLRNVFFIVLDLRLTKVGVQRYSFFYVRTRNITSSYIVMGGVTGQRKNLRDFVFKHII